MASEPLLIKCLMCPACQQWLPERGIIGAGGRGRCAARTPVLAARLPGRSRGSLIRAMVGPCMPLFPQVSKIFSLWQSPRGRVREDADLNGTQGMAGLKHGAVQECRKRDRSAEPSFLMLHLKMSEMCAPAVMWLQSICSSTGVCSSNAQSRQQGKWRRHHRACSCGQAAEIRVWPGS